MELSHRDAINGNGNSHEIYRIARDARDLLLFDQISRETLRRLSGSTIDEFQGVSIPATVIQYIKLV
jgi:hypothetical protein